MRKPWVLRFVAYAWVLLVVVGSCLPGGSTPRVDIPNLDKVVHLIMYAGVVLLWSLKETDIEKGKILKIFISSIVLGVVMEILQGVVFVSRSFEILDIIANIMGSIIGLVLFYKFFKKRKVC